MTDSRADSDRAPVVVIWSCMVGTIVMVSLTRQWYEVAFFASFFLLGLLRWLGLAPPPPRRGTEIALRRQLTRINVGFWVVILGAAVTSCGFRPPPRHPSLCGGSDS